MRFSLCHCVDNNGIVCDQLKGLVQSYVVVVVLGFGFHWPRC